MSDCWELPHGSAFNAETPVYGWRFEHVEHQLIPSPRVWLGTFSEGADSIPAACPTQHLAPHAKCDLCGLRMVRDTTVAITLAVQKENKSGYGPAMRMAVLVGVAGLQSGVVGDQHVADPFPHGTCVRMSHLRLIGPGFTPREDVAAELSRRYGLPFYSLGTGLWGHHKDGIARVAQQYPLPVMAS